MYHTFPTSYTLLLMEPPRYCVIHKKKVVNEGCREKQVGFISLPIKTNLSGVKARSMLTSQLSSEFTSNFRPYMLITTLCDMQQITPFSSNGKLHPKVPSSHPPPPSPRHAPTSQHTHIHKAPAIGDIITLLVSA